jgi:hypothetical protein
MIFLSQSDTNKNLQSHIIIFYEQFATKSNSKTETFPNTKKKNLAYVSSWRSFWASSSSSLLSHFVFLPRTNLMVKQWVPGVVYIVFSHLSSNIEWVIFFPTSVIKYASNVSEHFFISRYPSLLYNYIYNPLTLNYQELYGKFGNWRYPWTF